MYDLVGPFDVGNGSRKIYSKLINHNWSLARHYDYPNQMNVNGESTRPNYNLIQPFAYRYHELA